MGIGSNWFKRELGKNTGKYVSTKLFGDKHATPHKIIVAREDSKIEKQNSENLINTEIKKLEIQQKGSLNEKKEFILTKILSNDKNEVFDFGNYLITEIKSNGWSDKDENTYLNNFSDVCLNKLSQCKIKLDSLEATFESNHLEAEIKNLRNKKLFQKYYKYAGIVILSIIFFICYKLGLIE
jgi:hypothetical protein